MLQSSSHGWKISVVSSSSLEEGEKRSVSSIFGSLVKIGTGISSLWATGRIAEGILGLFQILLVFLIETFYIDKAEIAVIYMIAWFPPNHRHSKLKFSILSLRPWSQGLNIGFAHFMRSPMLVFVTKWYFEVRKIQALNKVSNVTPLSLQRKVSTDITKYIWIIWALSSVRCRGHC